MVHSQLAKNSHTLGVHSHPPSIFFIIFFYQCETFFLSQSAFKLSHSLISLHLPIYTLAVSYSCACIITPPQAIRYYIQLYMCFDSLQCCRIKIIYIYIYIYIYICAAVHIALLDLLLLHIDLHECFSYLAWLSIVAK